MSYSDYCRQKRDEYIELTKKCSSDIFYLAYLVRLINNTRELTYYGQLEFKKSNQELNVGFRGARANIHKSTYKKIDRDLNLLEEKLEGTYNEMESLKEVLKSRKIEYTASSDYWNSAYEAALEEESKEE